MWNNSACLSPPCSPPWPSDSSTTREPSLLAPQPAHLHWSTSFSWKEPLESTKTEDKGTMLDFVKNNVLEPFKQTLKTVFKRRENGLRLLILLSLFTYCIYWSLVTFNQMIYLYLSKVFEGFDGRDNAIYLAYLRVLGMISLFVIMPIISKRLQVHSTKTVN